METKSRREFPVTVVLGVPGLKPGEHLLILDRFKTIRDAEGYIAEKEKVDPEGVHRGDYGIDAPEGMH